MVFREEEAARRASLVSGPFEAAPPAYLIPADRDSLGELVRWAWEEGIPLVPRGGGTGMPGGNLGPHLIVETGPEFAEIDVLDPETGRLRVGAGALAADVEAAARELGFFVPFLPSSSRWCRVGGMVANNAAGARSFRFGAAAAWVISVEGFLSWGEPFHVGPGLPAPDAFRKLRERLEGESAATLRGWPRLRKNSSGYALDRFLPDGDAAQLLVGSEGTLAFLSGVELQLAPAPAGTGLALLPAHSPEELTAIALGAAGIGTVTCEFLGHRLLDMSGLRDDPELAPLARDAYALVLLEVQGTEDEVGRMLEGVRKLGDGIGGGGISAREEDRIAGLWALRHAASPMIARAATRGLISTQFIEDSVVPPEALGEYLEGLDAILRATRFEAVVFGHAGDGNVHVNPLIDVGSPDWAPRVRQALDEVVGLVAALGGTLAGEHGDGRLRAPLLSRIWRPAAVEAFRLVKQTLDPRGIMNPGVVLPLPGQDPLTGFAPRHRPNLG